MLQQLEKKEERKRRGHLSFALGRLPRGPKQHFHSLVFSNHNQVDLSRCCLVSPYTPTTMAAVDQRLPGSRRDTLSRSVQGNQATEQQQGGDLWTQILLSVQTARSTPICPVVILGEPQSGKSTLIRGLAEGCPTGFVEAGSDQYEDSSIATADPRRAAAAAAGGTTNGSPNLEEKERKDGLAGSRDLGLAYGYCDVPDDEGEGEC